MSASSIKVQIQRLPHAGELPLPDYATPDSAGLDLAAAVVSDLVLPPGERALVPTGLAIALPPGFEAQIRPRSGLAFKHGISVVNTPGTIDADYRGEVKVLLINHGQESFVITRGMRIAQMVVAAFSRVAWEEMAVLPTSDRGQGGFGSTGTASKKQTAA